MSKDLKSQISNSESKHSEFRVEHDSMGDVRVPAGAYYGADAAGRRKLSDLRLAAAE